MRLVVSNRRQHLLTSDRVVVISAVYGAVRGEEAVEADGCALRGEKEWEGKGVQGRSRARFLPSGQPVSGYSHAFISVDFLWEGVIDATTYDKVVLLRS